MPGGMLWVRRAHLCRAGQKDGTAGRAACCFCAKWGKGARPNRQAPLSFLEDGAKDRRARRPPEQAGPLLFLGAAQRAGEQSARLNRQAPLVISWGGAKRPEGKAPARTGRRPCHSLRMAQRAGGKSARPNRQAPLLFLRGRCKGPEGKAPACPLPFQHVYPAF